MREVTNTTPPNWRCHADGILNHLSPLAPVEGLLRWRKLLIRKAQAQIPTALDNIIRVVDRHLRACLKGIKAQTIPLQDTKGISLPHAHSSRITDLVGGTCPTQELRLAKMVILFCEQGRIVERQLRRLPLEPTREALTNQTSLRCLGCLPLGGSQPAAHHTRWYHCDGKVAWHWLNIPRIGLQNWHRLHFGCSFGV